MYLLMESLLSIRDRWYAPLKEPPFWHNLFGGILKRIHGFQFSFSFFVLFLNTISEVCLILDVSRSVGVPSKVDGLYFVTICCLLPYTIWILEGKFFCTFTKYMKKPLELILNCYE